MEYNCNYRITRIRPHLLILEVAMMLNTGKAIDFESNIPYYIQLVAILKENIFPVSVWPENSKRAGIM
jgi:hypothetical protein